MKCENSQTLRQLASASQFVLQQSKSCSVADHIYVRIQDGKWPDTENMEVRFDTVGRFLGMFQSGADLYLVLQAPCHTHQGWLAQMNADFTQICIYAPAEQRSDHTYNIPAKFFDMALRTALIHFLALKQGIIVHAAGIVMHRKGFLFPGISGTGKSTLSQQIASNQAGTVLSEERIVIRKDSGRFSMYGLPWTGQPVEYIQPQKHVAELFFITHGTTNSIVKISPQKAIQRLLPTLSIPWNHHEIVSQMLQVCDELLVSVPMHELICTPTSDVVDTLLEHIAKQESIEAYK